MAVEPFLEALNGTWKLAAPSADETAFPDSFPHEIPVPGLVDLARDYDFRKTRFHHYARELGADPAKGYANVDLVLEQSMWTSAVWCNRRFSAMSSEPYLPQRFPLAPLLEPGGRNQVVVRVGQYDTLPTRHMGGNDYERLEWIPGIWGDAKLHRYGAYEITGVMIVPEQDLGGCRVRVRVRRATKGKAPVLIRAAVRDARGNVVASDEAPSSFPLDGNVETEVLFHFRWPSVAAWHPDSPNLYDFTAEAFEIDSNTVPTDRAERRFGIRHMAIRGRDVLLNGERIRLRGGNVAFHRLMGDVDRGALPWDRSFARKCITEIPRANNMNCLRLHIGAMYNPWYDEADAGGMLLLEEWPFWNVTASREHVAKAFAEWLWTQNHHPSIAMWDPGNECEMGNLLEHVVPALKQLDPSRPWMHAEMDEEHPYHWALIPLHPRRAMGFTRSHEEIRDGARPSSVNEFGWFWTDGEGVTTSLTELVRQRWLPDGLTAEEHLAYQAWLVRECTEVWRRFDTASIQPFIYLSTSKGLTGNWFRGPLGDLNPKPVLRAFAESIAPLGVSYEIAGRHYLAGERVAAKLHLFNDFQHSVTIRVRFGFADANRRWLAEPQHLEMLMHPVSTRIVDLSLEAPRQTGSWRLLACTESGRDIEGVSEKHIDVLPVPHPARRFAEQRVHLVGDDAELKAFLIAHGAVLVDSMEAANTVVASGEACRVSSFEAAAKGLDGWLRAGGLLVLLQPDFGLEGSHTLAIGEGVQVTTTAHFDKDVGGYDTVAIPTAQAPAELLKGMPPLHLGYFNGGLGNIIAEESDINLGDGMERWLVCGLDRKRTAVAAVRVGKGLVVASRLQFNGRLRHTQVADSIGSDSYPRLPDPLAQQLLLNLLSS